MPRVICRIPTATSPINGVAFAPDADGHLVSAELSEDQAARFASIPGYALVVPSEPPSPAPRRPKGSAKAEARDGDA